MLIAEHSVKIYGSPEVIWKKWTEVDKWNRWDHEIEYSELFGPFEKGTKGVLKPKGAPKAHFVLSDVNQFKSFVDVSQLPLAYLTFSHYLKRVNPKECEITHRIDINGPLGFFFKLLFGNKMKKGLPIAMNNLKRLLEK